MAQRELYGENLNFTENNTMVPGEGVKCGRKETGLLDFFLLCSLRTTFESLVVLGDKDAGPFGTVLPEVEIQWENRNSKIDFLCELILTIVNASIIIVYQSLYKARIIAFGDSVDWTSVCLSLARAQALAFYLCSRLLLSIKHDDYENESLKMKHPKLIEKM